MRRRRMLIRIILILLLLIFVVPLLIPLPPDGVAAETLADPGGTFVEVNGLQTYVLEAGDASAPPALLLHGFGGSTVSWRETMDALASAGYRAIAFDRPPYGLSQKSGDGIPYTPEAGADFTAALMDALGIERAVLVGHSAGGGVIAQFAVRYPERVQKLVFVAGAVPIGGSGRGGGAFGVPEFGRTLLTFPSFNRAARIGIRLFVRPEAFVDMLRSAYYDPATVTPAVAAGYQRALRVVGWDEALVNIVTQNGGGQPLTSEQLEAINLPALLVWGQEDTWVPIAAGERLRALLPNNEWIVYPAVGHLPMEENPQQFNADLIAFLQQ
jgi:pimeloyl-ACP methyl ester carboxylesterase